jgi:RNA polymerase sigma factor (sigma-70 family)
VTTQFEVDTPDAEFLSRFIARRDEDAFEALVRVHGPMVLGVCRRILGNHHDAEDAFQATFLVLAHRAAAISPKAMVGNWLYGVACRTALKARAERMKRHKTAMEIYEMSARDSTVQDRWPELLPWLDLELNRLPDKYRLPLLLCDLQGKTQTQAASQLGLPVGTLSARLSRGRAKLAERMVRHGVVLTVAALIMVMSQQLASAGPPSDILVLSTAKAASHVSTAEAPYPGLIAPDVAALANGVLKSMMYSKFKVATGILLTMAGIIASMGGVAQYVRAYGLSHRPDDATRKLNDELADTGKKAALTPFDPTSGWRPGQIRDDNGLAMKLVWCPAAEFLLGSPKSERNRNPTEDQVKVTLTSGFWMGRTEVTQRQWWRLMGTTPWKSEKGFGRGKFENGQLVLDGPITNLAPWMKEGGEYPAACVTWEAAIEFCDKLTEHEREGGRLAANWEYTLPTDAQWEYACRAGTTTAYSFGDDESRLGDFAWWGGMNGGGNAQLEQYAHQVGLKKPNPWGLFDMLGNVQEWCRDWDGVDRIDARMPGRTDPAGPRTGKYRVVRGGSWAHDAGFNCSAQRFGLDPATYSSSTVGFRVALVRSEPIQ